MRQYETFEIRIKGPQPKESCAQVDLTGIFKNGLKTIRVPGFYAGDGIYVVRFYPKEAGTYFYNIVGTVKASGAVICKEALPGNHGMVKTKGTHFCFEDGTWFYPFGTTVYALSHQEDELVHRTFDTLSQSPFNKVRMCVFPKHLAYNHNEPPVYSKRGSGALKRRKEALLEEISQEDAALRPSDFPFEKGKDGRWDVNHPCCGFWDKLEADLRRLYELGIQCDLILFHPYDRWGFAKLGKEEAFTYLDYVTRRLSAFPNIWWCLANEYDTMEYPPAYFDEFARFVHDHDPYGHLLSNHMMMIPWDFSNPNATHICLQTRETDRTTQEILKFEKPLINDELGYEGNLPFDWGNRSAFAIVNDFWKVCVQGGYCTHGETFLHENELVWWAKGGELVGESPARIAFLKDFLESLPGPLTSATKVFTEADFDKLLSSIPENEKELPINRIFRSCSFEQARRIEMDAQQICGHFGEEALVKYYGRKCPCEGKIELPAGGVYNIEVIDVWEMTRTLLLTRVSGRVSYDLPGKEGIAVLAIKVRDDKQQA